MDLNQVLDRIAALAVKVLAADAAAVYWLEESGERLTVAAGYGLPDGFRSRPAFLGEESPLDRTALATGQVVAVEDAASDPRGSSLLPGFVAALCAPLGSPEQPLGTLHVYSRHRRRFHPEEIERLKAAADLGTVALEAVRGLADLERVEASKSQFIRVATHELRSPITVAQSLVRNVLKGYAGPLTDLQREVFARVSGRLDFLESLVNDLLDLAASKAPELTEAEGAVAVNSSVGRAILLLAPRAEEKGVALTALPSCEELAVWATEEGMDRIFVNLVGNAVKYTPSGGRVTISMGRDDGQVWVRVADTGIGIPEEALPHLFEEFYRAPNARAFNAVGTGLGLAIVKELVERYGGHIEVESTLGQGTTFTVTFPVWQDGAP